ncbi:specific 2-thiouridylase MnmA [Seminavis robusta]|uniref:tRNA-5-taurinomethyluridine 2-sulfurtransferase n=1 Tax=Seminavis robusta TaxID=568900 RepID=A0A9N8DTP0_9STRA|nr:specific 2-thiouridylase MnmA [Seminavis robusta]|eukprot:Sro271_g104550.1 specific 2-thiouridylase MnmA (668) ;mRNA; f:36695-38698
MVNIKSKHGVFCSLLAIAVTLPLDSVASAFVPSLLPFQGRRHDWTLPATHHSFELLSREFNDCSVPEIQKILVQKGAEFKQRQDEQESDTSTSTAPVLKSSFDKVPGCVANVHIQTSLIKRNQEEDYQVTYKGHADALLSRGLMAALMTVLDSCDVDEVRHMDPASIAEQMGVRRALSPGRNDGLANMMQVIQNQIQTLLSSSETKKTDESVETVDSTKTRDIAPLYVDETGKSNEEPGRHQSARGDSSVAVESDIPTKKKATVALLLSGGVDSSVALRLLLKQGYNVTAFYLKIWLEDELAHLGQCPWEDDYNVCRQVCEQAGVSLESISLQEEYRDRVISYTIHEAERGRTPNPDILCNSRIKFGCFYDAIAGRDFDFVASGHYARLEPNFATTTVVEAGKREPMRLFRAPDPVKDQSYFLCALSQEQLQRVIFPIGHLQKAQVRELAESFQLPNRHRADSQGLCFLGKVKFEDFLGAYLGERPGDIVDAATGDILGQHRGVWFHTVGQRKGIGKVLYPKATAKGPWYVVAKDPSHDLVFCSNQYDEDIFTAARSEFHVEDIKWVAGKPPSTVQQHENGSGRFEMKIRHGPRLVQGTLTLIDPSGDEGTVKLDRKDGGLAPGQYVVFYVGEECHGGGVISERHWAKFLLQREETQSKNQTTALQT